MFGGAEARPWVGLNLTSAHSIMEILSFFWILRQLFFSSFPAREFQDAVAHSQTRSIHRLYIHIAAGHAEARTAQRSFAEEARGLPRISSLPARITSSLMRE